MQQRWNRAK